MYLKLTFVMLVLLAACRPRNSQIKEIISFGDRTQVGDYMIPLNKSGLQGNSVSAKVVGLVVNSTLTDRGVQISEFAKKELYDEFNRLTQRVFREIGKLEVNSSGIILPYGNRLVLTEKQRDSGFVSFQDLRNSIKKSAFPMGIDSPEYSHIFRDHPELTPSEFKYQPSCEPGGRFGFKANRIRLDMECTLGIKKNNPNSQVTTSEFYSFALVQVELDFAKPIFEQRDIDDGFARINVADLTGIAQPDSSMFFYDDKEYKASLDLSSAEKDSPNVSEMLGARAKSKILRFDLRGERKIYVEDRFDFERLPLKGSEIGRTIQRGLKIAVASLRKDFPELGNRIVLQSELSRENPSSQIVFRIVPTNRKEDGEATQLFDDETGEKVFNLISINIPSARPKDIGLKDLGLIADLSKQLQEVSIYVVLHEFGHALGLAHNFAGYGFDKNGKPRFNAIMSYMHYVPIDLTIGTVSAYLDYDILALRYLYADQLFSDGNLVRKQALAALQKMPFESHSVFEPIHGERHLDQAIDFIMTIHHPIVDSAIARANGREVFKRRLQEAYYK